MKQITIVLLLMMIVPGCATIAARLDTDAAIEVLAIQNHSNVEIAYADRVAFRDGLEARLDASFKQKLGLTQGGAEAVKMLDDYIEKKAEMNGVKVVELQRYGLMVSNSAELLGFIRKNRAMTAWLNSMIGRFPAAAHIKAIAETETRAYMDKITRGLPQ